VNVCTFRVTYNESDYPWQDMIITAQFRSRNNVVAVAPIAKDEIYSIPWEVLTDKSFGICLYGSKDASTANYKLYPTEETAIPTDISGYDPDNVGHHPVNPTPEIYMRVLESVEEYQQLAEQISQDKEIVLSSKEDTLSARDIALAAANDALVSASYSTHPPLYNPDTETWMMWNGEQYITTGYAARGPQGLSGVYTGEGNIDNFNVVIDAAGQPDIVIDPQGGADIVIDPNGDPEIPHWNPELVGTTLTVGTHGKLRWYGKGVTSILRTSGDGSPGTTDTYTITYTDGTTHDFYITNGHVTPEDRAYLDGLRTQAAQYAQDALAQATIAMQKASEASDNKNLAYQYQQQALIHQQTAYQNMLAAQQASLIAQQAMSDILAMLDEDIPLMIGGKIQRKNLDSISLIRTVTANTRADMLALTSSDVQIGDGCRLLMDEDGYSHLYQLQADDPSVYENWLKISMPDEYASEAGHARSADEAVNSLKTNGHRFVVMEHDQYDNAVVDTSVTIYLVFPNGTQQVPT